MTVFQVIAVLMAVVNSVICMCRSDHMTWRTHAIRPQLAIMLAGILAASGGYIATSPEHPEWWPLAMAVECFVAAWLMSTYPSRPSPIHEPSRRHQPDEHASSAI
jgi:hypothetical protein